MAISSSGEDLSIYFYRLQREQDWIARNAIGEPVQGNWISRYGGDPNIPHMLCLTVWGMGDINSSDVAQRVH